MVEKKKLWGWRTQPVENGEIESLLYVNRPGGYEGKGKQNHIMEGIEMKKEAVIINVTINNEVYTVSYESGTVRTYKKATKPITAWIEAHSGKACDQSEEEAPEAAEAVSDEVSNEAGAPEDVFEDVAEGITEEAVEAVKATVAEETALVALEPAEVVVIEEETAAEVVEEVSEPVEVIEVIQDPAEAPAFDWREAAEIAKAAIKALVAACRTAAPVVKAGCIGLWHLIGLVAMALVSLFKTIRLYGPDIIAEVVTDAKVAYYKTKALYFRTRRLARASVRAAKRARKVAKRMARTARLATWKVTGTAMEVAKMVAAPIIAAAMVAVMMTIKASAKMARAAVNGWAMREDIMDDIKREERA